MRISTARKILVARLLHRAVTVGRRLLGQHGELAECRRNGLRWSLDLSEGIDLAIYLFGQFERSTARALQRLAAPGMTVLDIGANIGAHSLPLARRVGPAGRVVAVEPTDWAFGKLVANLRLNPQLEPALRPIQAVLVDGQQSPPAAFYARWSLADREDPRHPIHQGALCGATGAQQLTLDQLVDSQQLARVDLIKLDVDGSEYEVLRGGEQTLRAHRPPIVMELCEHGHDERGHSMADVVALILEAGYALVDESHGRPLPSDIAALRRLLPPGGGMNIVAVPAVSRAGC